MLTRSGRGAKRGRTLRRARRALAPRPALRVPARAAPGRREHDRALYDANGKEQH